MARFDWSSRQDLEAREKADAMQALRDERDRLLRDTDWTQLPDAPLTAAERAEWIAYRQTLRDLPKRAEQAGDPGTVRPPRPPRIPERRDPGPPITGG